MKPELIAIVKQLKEKKEAQDVYFQTIPTDLRVSVIDNKFPIPLYTTPQRRTWVGLTDDERKEVWFSCEQQTPTTFARAIEAKLKEKNT
jgi:hypothetical protein